MDQKMEEYVTELLNEDYTPSSADDSTDDEPSDSEDIEEEYRNWAIQQYASMTLTTATIARAKIMIYQEDTYYALK